MLRTYIKNSLASVNSLVVDNSTKGRINDLIIKAYNAWTAPVSLSTPTNLKDLIRWEVNAFLTANRKAPALIKAATTGDAKKDTKTNRNLTGTLRVTSLRPYMGYTDDGYTVTFNSPYELEIGQILPYEYIPSTGLYNVRTYSKGKARPFRTDPLGGDIAHEQFGKAIFDQNPNFNTNIGVKSKIPDDLAMAVVDDKLVFRMSTNRACFIDGYTYKEVRTVKTATSVGMEVLKELDLSSVLTPASDEYLTIGKYLQYKGLILILIFKHTRFSTFYPATDDPALGKRYDFRFGGATIRGELVILDPATDRVSLINKSAVTAAHQIRYSGFIDMLLDLKTGELILAELSGSNVRGLTYNTSKIYIDHTDRVYHRTAADDVTCNSISEYNTWLSKEVYDHGWPTKVHIKSAGSSKTWDLNFPDLSVIRYKIEVTAVPFLLTPLKLLYNETNSTIDSKHSISCKGGYINAMLYQDPYDTDNSIYLARGYDAWLQYPTPSDDYTVTPGELQGTSMYVFDTGKYVNGATPGEIIGMFGTDFFKLNPDGSATFLANVPGGHGRARPNYKDDIPGDGKCNGLTTDTYNTLLALNNLVTTDYINTIKMQSVFHIFNGGAGSAKVADSQYLTGQPFEYVWGEGLHVHNQRFIVMTDKTDPDKKRIVFTGSYEVMSSTLGIYNYRCHYETEMTNTSEGGIFSISTIPTVVEGRDYWKLEGTTFNWMAFSNIIYLPKGNTYRGTTLPAENWYSQFTMQCTRSDLLQLDKNTTYCIISAFRRQYDKYVFYNAMIMSGWLWWMNDRQVIRLDNGTMGCYTKDYDVNLYGDVDNECVETPNLNYY